LSLFSRRAVVIPLGPVLPSDLFFPGSHPPQFQILHRLLNQAPFLSFRPLHRALPFVCLLLEKPLRFFRFQFLKVKAASGLLEVVRSAIPLFATHLSGFQLKSDFLSSLLFSLRSVVRESPRVPRDCRDSETYTAPVLSFRSSLFES